MQKQLQNFLTDELAYFASRLRDEIEYSFGKYSSLYSVYKHITESRGKHIRPILVFLFHKLYTDIDDDTYSGAVCLELIHIASLLHDDVIDNATQRRNNITVNAKWDNKTAILAGDCLLAHSVSLAQRNQYDGVLAEVSHTLKELTQGELLQMHTAQSANASMSVYWDIIRKKTASLIMAAVRMGAITAKVDNEILERITKIGYNIGMAFQMQDDILDFTVDNDTGKRYGNDIKEGKFTLPVLSVLGELTGKEQQMVIDIIQQDTKTITEIDRVIEIVVKNGGLEKAYSRLQGYINEGKEIVASLSGNKEVLTVLLDLFDFLAVRKR